MRVPLLTTLDLEDGTLHSWGEGRNGELGNGQLERSSKPVQLKGIPSEVSSFSCHAQHSLAVAGTHVPLYLYSFVTAVSVQTTGRACTVGVKVRMTSLAWENIAVMEERQGKWAHALMALK